MGTKKTGIRKRAPPQTLSQDVVQGVTISELLEKHRMELENLTLASQPFQTLIFFILAIMQYIKNSVVYILTSGIWFVLLSVLLLALGFMIIGVDGASEKYVQEFLSYFRFVIWWVALGVASSIGLGKWDLFPEVVPLFYAISSDVYSLLILGSGLHTFVLYLGPHIAFFTIKAMHCGRVDLKTAPYDTIQLERGPSWLDKDCSEFGPPLFPSLPDSLVRVPLSSILPQVQLEAVLWGFGTALGELPPYFISKAASISGSKLEAVEELDASKTENGVISGPVNKLKCWLFSHSQHLNFFTILILASVPNPLFDLAGIMCGQFGIPFWKFFLATMTGKAFIKAHIQTIFIISVCNNQLLEWTEKELIRVFGYLPGLSSVFPTLIYKLRKVKEKYLTAAAPASSSVKATTWDLSWSSVWGTLVWLMLLHFFVKIVTSTAQRFLKQQQELELATLTSKLSASRDPNQGKTDQACQLK